MKIHIYIFLWGLALIALGFYVSIDHYKLIRYGMWEHTAWNWWNLIAGTYTMILGLKRIENAFE